ncbi:MAG: recombination protein NinB [Polynucleobacter sp.]
MIFNLINQAVRLRCCEAIMSADEGMRVEIKERKRSLDQNAAQWPILQAFSEQIKWPVNGELVTLEPDELKDILTAAFFGESVRLAQGLNGGVVMLGKRTSKFTKKEFSDWLEFLHAAAAARGVVVYQEQRRAA